MLEESLLVVNPRRRKKRHARRSRRRRYANPRAHRRFRSRRRRHRNPRFKIPSVGGITHEIVPAVIGAGGALALDVGMAYLPLPDVLKSGWGKTLALLGGALLVGFVGSRVPFIGRRNAQVMTLGALTIVAYNAIKPLAAHTIGDKVKGLNGLADFGDFGAYMQPKLGAYMSPAPALLPGSARSPIAAAGQLGAYMGATGGDYF